MQLTFHRRVLVLMATAFVLHYIWEGLHVPLYGGYEHITNMPIALYTTLGDVLYTLCAVFVVALIKGRADWFAAPSARDIVALATIGGFIAAFVEYKALAFNRWYYLADMPLVPFLDIGLTPLLQMVILLPLSIYLAALADRAIRRLFW